MVDREDIRNIFLTRTISDFLGDEVHMPFIKFVFDEKSLMDFENYLDNNDLKSYHKGLKSIEYLCQIRQQWLNGEDDIFIVVHDSSKFFSLLDELINTYSRSYPHRLIDCRNYIRSIWLRMGVADVINVEDFLKQQLVFLKNSYRVPELEEIAILDDNESLFCSRNENEDWFETDKNLRFSIRWDDYHCDEGSEKKSFDDFFDNYISHIYNFPSIHFALANSKGRNTCFVYGIQNLPGTIQKSMIIKEQLQPLRRKFRNKYVSADHIIALGLLLDYLYDRHIEYIEIPTLQVFNYAYHEELSSSISEDFSQYSEEEKDEFERLDKIGESNQGIYNYLYLKELSDTFVDKQDLISKNKTERLIHTVLELIEHYPSIELVSEPFVQSENMVIRLTGRISILDEVYDNRKSVNKIYCI